MIGAIFATIVALCGLAVQSAYAADASCPPLLQSEAERVRVQIMYFNHAATGHMNVVKRDGAVISAYNGFGRYSINMGGAGSRDPFRTIRLMYQQEADPSRTVSIRAMERVARTNKLAYVNVILSLSVDEADRYFEYIESREGELAAQTCAGGVARALAAAGMPLAPGLSESPVYCLSALALRKKIGDPRVEKIEVVGTTPREYFREFFRWRTGAWLEPILVPLSVIAMKFVKLFYHDRRAKLELRQLEQQGQGADPALPGGSTDLEDPAGVGGSDGGDLGERDAS